LLINFANFTLDTDRRELRDADGAIHVEPQVFDLLFYFAQNTNRVIGKDELIEHVWKGRIVSDAALNSRINSARRAVGETGEKQTLIRTVPRRGFLFAAEVKTPADDQAPSAVRVDTPADQPKLTLPDKPSIAVLPFANLSGDPEQEYFADGMADEIITALSRCSSFFVISRNSSFTYKGKAADARQVGRELGVRYLMEGSIRRSGDRLRFTGQLIETGTGAHIWADRFEGDMQDIFALQDRITESVTAAIEPKLQSAEIERMKQKPASNLVAYDLLLRAQQFESEFTEKSLANAIQCVEKALAIDSAYAPAMALGAYCYAERRLQGWVKNFDAEAAEGLRLAWQAIELEPENGTVLWMAAFAFWHLGLDAPRSRELFSRSLVINPNSAIALTMAGWIEAFTGNTAKGFELIERAQRLSPRDTRGWLMSTGMATGCMHERRFEEAIDWAEKALVQNRRSAILLRILGAAHSLLGNREKAANIVQELMRIDPQLTVSGLRDRVPFALNEPLWKMYSEALRAAGLPE
jgi:TolB-like protein/tetratricopeptide (TPR) repeat protein